jgi:hypothetical protein
VRARAMNNSCHLFNFTAVVSKFEWLVACFLFLMECCQSLKKAASGRPVFERDHGASGDTKSSLFIVIYIYIKEIRMAASCGV